MRLIAGEVTAEKFKAFNSLRFKLINENPDWARFLEKKSRFVKTIVEIFISNPMTIMELAEKVENDEQGV